MAIHLATLGGLSVADDCRPVERLLALRSRAALLVYVAVERRVVRESLMAMFWPESDAANARHALRQSLYHLRSAAGGVGWIDAGAHEIVARRELHVDACTFADAARSGDVERAVRLYRGPFLDGVHLADLRSWESWVDARRAHYARTFRWACRELIDARCAAGDLAGAIAVAERWTAPEPTDDEAQHRLIELLAAAGERTEAIRQYETYARLLAPEGLEPLDATRDLVEHLRRRRGTFPTATGSSSDCGTVRARQRGERPPGDRLSVVASRCC